MNKLMMLMALLAVVLVASAPALAQDGETTGGTTDGETTGVVSPDENDGGVVSPDTNNVPGIGVPERGADEGTRTLPFTGGILPVAAALGALLIAGGLIARRTIR